MDKSKKVYKKSRDIVCREIDNEMILMPIYKTNKDINEMYTLNESASKMWELIDGKKALNEIADELCAVYEAEKKEIETDLAEFVKDMLEIKAIE